MVAFQCNGFISSFFFRLHRWAFYLYILSLCQIKNGTNIEHEKFYSTQQWLSDAHCAIQKISSFSWHGQCRIVCVWIINCGLLEVCLDSDLISIHNLVTRSSNLARKICEKSPSIFGTRNFFLSLPRYSFHFSFFASFLLFIEFKW